MVRWLTLILFGLFSVSAVGAAAFAQAGAAATTAQGATVPPETWADPGLTVRRGLALWLDASSLNAARRVHGIAEASSGTRIETWYDGSGHRRHLTQARAQAQPLFIDGALRFDGQASFLERAGLKVSLEDFTLFVVAAPLSNSGGFRAFLAMHQQDREDFTSGVTVDMGFGYSGRFDALNVEGKGFGGMANLMAVPSDFGVVRRMTISSAPGPKGTTLRMDDQPAKSRDRAPSACVVDRIMVGARFFGNPPSDRGFLDGDILEILVYDRVLDQAERKTVEGYLAARHGGKDQVVRPARLGPGKPLIAVRNPPAVQMLVPGFSTRELPVDLTNVNNVRYRPDGKLVALAYDGNIYLLSDANGDGIEEKVELFWENKGNVVAPIGMALTPPGYRLGDGAFVASKGKVSLIVDADHDGSAEKEIVVASGWKELPHGVDALGVALDRAGDVYFGLGTTDFTNAYVVDANGRAAYRLSDDHGTIQKVSPDFSRREIIATGIRFPVGLAFNRVGDMFATDQEGATWLANGNPFDELLHIQKGRHYGFPPRHPQHLPSVIDEPSLFDYLPQHQSTCGLSFNEPVSGGPTFGPAQWAGDALITGYSRGKLYRTKLVKTQAGYVAGNQVLAILNMLAADACVSPTGDLVVAVHSGWPDWGSGPRGKGKLYKISYSGREVPQPVLAWAAGPQEARVAFDRPLDPAALRDLAARSLIEYGLYVQPGDRFESLRPGYETVVRQVTTPRFELPILSTGISADRRTLMLLTAPHPEAASYALTLPTFGSGGSDSNRRGTLPQVAAMDLRYDLSGVDASWRGEARERDWSGWLPHIDLDVARALITGSADHDQLWDAMKRPGRLTLKTKLDLWQMLRPAVQPGSTTGYRLPDEEVTLTVEASGPIEVSASGGKISSDADPSDRSRIRIVMTPKERAPLPLEFSVATNGSTAINLTWTTREDDRPRALPLRRFVLPWVSLEKRSQEVAERHIPELKGGDWARGRALFHGDMAKCASCHKVGGRGADIGPDLSNLVHRDYASVYRDIHSPGAAINPDYVSQRIALSDGRVLEGVIRTDGDRLIVGDTNGRRTVVERDQVDAMAASSTSIMPEGLDLALGPGRVRDLLTFLLTDPLGPAKLEGDGAPPPRRRAEVDAALKGSKAIEVPRQIRIVLASGPKDHGPGEHDYPAWRTRWSVLLATAPAVVVETADGWPSSRQLDTADVIVFYSNNPGWDEAKAQQLDRYFARGGGIVMIHYAVDGHGAVDALANRVGLAWQGGKSAFRHGPLDVDFSGSKHPITRGLNKLHFVDESYWNLIGDPASIEVLGTGVEAGQPRPLFWTRQVGKGRVFTSIPGHFSWTFDDPLFRLLLLRGMAWAAGEPVDRFNELITLGARIDK
jgi:putative heme-binding domain-containing protein